MPGAAQKTRLDENCDALAGDAELKLMMFAARCLKLRCGACRRHDSRACMYVAPHIKYLNFSAGFWQKNILLEFSALKT